MRHVLLWCALIGLFHASAAARPGDALHRADLGRCELESGEAIEPCTIGYRTFGRLDADRSNAILVPMWFGGQTDQLHTRIGPGKVLDSTRYFIVAVDPFGNGVSSSPSNSPAQPGERFPRFTIRDMVRAQHRLVTEVLGLDGLHAVLGVSMGGMQAFEWAVTYPDFAGKIVSIAGSPQLTSYDLLVWETGRRAIDATRRCEGCDPVGVHTLLFNLLMTTPEHRVEATPPGGFADLVAGFTDRARPRFRPDDVVSQLRAMMAHDVAAAYGGDLARAAERVTADLLVVVASTDHLVRPEPALAFARLTASRAVVLDSPCGHLADSCEAERVAAEVNTFLAR